MVLHQHRIVFEFNFNLKLQNNHQNFHHVHNPPRSFLSQSKLLNFVFYY